MEAVDEPVSDEELGRLVRSALAAGRDEVPYSAPDMERRVGMLLKIAGVRSAAQFVRSTHEVNVEPAAAPAFFQLMPAGFGRHAAGHLASAAGVRGYARAW